MSEPTSNPPRWQMLVGHGFPVPALSADGLSSFYAPQSDVIELRADIREPRTDPGPLGLEPADLP